jgi:VWFA-related protein
MKSGAIRMQCPVLFAVLCSPIVPPASAGPQATAVPPVPTLHAETRVVQIDVIVRDSHGKPVTDLTKADFVITDNGKARAIDIFSVNRGDLDRGTPAPPAATSTAVPPSQSGAPNLFSNRNQGPPNLPGHSTVIVLDQVNAFFEDAGYARQQVLNLMGKLKPDERIALYVIARKRGLVIVQDYTTDHALLLRSLSKYLPRGLEPRPMFPQPWPVGVQDLPARPKPPSGGPPPPDASKAAPREFEFTWHENSEQARLSLQALAEQLSLVPGRKSVYWVTQAFPARLMQGMGQFAWDKTLTALNEANVAVNTVDSRGLFEGANPSGPTLTTMQQVAEATGGKAYFGRNDLDVAMAEGIEAARMSYTLGFYLADNERDNKYHALKVKVNRPGLESFYRQGYYAGNTELPVQAKETGEMEASLLNQVNSTGVGITARVDAEPGTPRGTVNIQLNLDPGTLSLKEKAGGWTGNVQETFVEVNESGNTLSKVSDSKAFEVTTANRAHYDSQGVAWPFSLPLMPGATKVTIIVRDTATGHVGSLTVPLM